MALRAGHHEHTPPRPLGAKPRRGPAARLVILLALLPFASGCRFGYYARQGWGQATILLGRVPIEKLLNDPNLDQARRGRFQLIAELRTFWRQRVGLAENDNYTGFYDLKGKALTHTVVACPADSLEPYLWSFLIVGEVPYIGFFDLADAEAEAARLKAEGYDVSIFEADAFSTLGWFSDPVLSSMLELDDVELVELLSHEQTHATVYVQGDIAFNETLGSFVGHAAAVAFFSARGDEKNLALAKSRRHDQVLVSRFGSALVKRLDELYASRRPRAEILAEKARVFARARFEFRREVLPRLRSDRYRGLARLRFNNAIVATMTLYNRDLERLEELHRRCGGEIRASFAEARRLAQGPEPSKALAERLARGPK